MVEKNLYKDFEHEFAQYVRILGKGQKGSRSLTQQEATSAFHMILEGKVLDVQLGAFLMLLRVKEESAEELAGSVSAIKTHLAHQIAKHSIQVDIDWSSYAGKKKQLPWFLYSLFLLAENGYRIVLHGEGGHTLNRLYTHSLFHALNLPIANTWEKISPLLDQYRFCYTPLETLCPTLSHIIQLRNVLGLRSPVHTIARLINPFDAPYSMQGIFHPNYRPVHQEAALLLGFTRMAVMKGEGGECERNPNADTLVQQVIDGNMKEATWPRTLPERTPGLEELSLESFVDIWQGKTENRYAELAAIDTLAITLQLIHPDQSQTDSQEKARNWWHQRNKLFL